MMKRLWILAGAALMACSSSDASPGTSPVGSGHGTCITRDNGTYVVHFVERTGGTCGPISDAVIQGANLASKDSVCTGPVTTTADGCETTIDQTCQSDAVSKGGTIKQTGKASWSSDASHGTGIETVIINDASGQSLCASTYDLTATRQ